MAGANVSTVAAQCKTNAAAVATALGGGVVTADVTALGAVLALLATSQDIMIPLLGQATTPATQTTMLNPA